MNYLQIMILNIEVYLNSFNKKNTKKNRKTNKNKKIL